ncbi:AI-2E family transporter [Nostoc sp. MS1]|uniref:AI-2E family transporter n=1 Tax=Nostoc sp. MS1 TaxID=2764711 RepID=UPI001CC3F42F|nr:AI-2E family transporter [Nostoc sp. MS1]BCL33777.1 AI-2E family transporter [Nostoc sp. MS1]
MNNIRQRLNNSFIIRFLLLFAFGWAALQLFVYFETVIVVFTFAAILAALLNYPVRWLRRFLPRTVAVILVFLISLLIAIALATTLGLAILSQGQQLIDRFLEIANSVGSLVAQLESFLQTRNLQLNLDAIAERIQNFALASVNYLISILGTSLTNFVNLIFITVVTLFMLLNGENVWRFVLKFIPEKSRNYFAATVEEKLLGFFRGQLLLMLFLSISTCLVFILLQVPYPLVLSLIIGILDAVPGIGATLGIGTVFLILLIQDIVLAFKVLAVSIILQQIQDNLISPRIMQNSVDINPLVTFFALLIGARIAGLLGVFLAVPIAGLVVSLLQIDELKGETNT